LKKKKRPLLRVGLAATDPSVVAALSSNRRLQDHILVRLYQFPDFFIRLGTKARQRVRQFVGVVPKLKGFLIRPGCDRCEQLTIAPADPHVPLPGAWAFNSSVKVLTALS